MLKNKITGILVCVALLLLLSPTCFAYEVKCTTTTFNPTKAQCGSSRNITCSGVKGKPGICAADLRVFPIGTILCCMDTLEVMIVGDSGSGVKGYHIDRWVRRQKDNKWYSSGNLKYYVLYKAPKSPRSQWKQMVEKSFFIRARILEYLEYPSVSRGYVSRSGKIDRRKALIFIKAKAAQELKKPKELKNGKTNNRRTSVQRYTGTNSFAYSKPCRFGNFSIEKLPFRPWPYEQAWSFTAIKSR